MTSERDTIQAWLMYYWRSLFYTSVPTRKQIEERKENNKEERVGNKCLPFFLLHACMYI